MKSEILREPNLNDRPSRTEARVFVCALVRWVGPGFHPDTDFNDYVDCESDARLFPKMQAARLNSNLDRAVAVLSQGGEDVYDVAAPELPTTIGQPIAPAD